MGLSATFKGGVEYKLSGSLGLGDAVSKFAGHDNIALADGSGSYQASKIYSASRTIAASGNEDLDLAGGSLLDPFGVALTFATIKAIIIKAKASNANDVIVGGAGANAFLGPFGAADDVMSVKPGGQLVNVAPDAGWTVTPSTADLLRVANSAGGTGVDYDIVIIGT